MLRRNPRIEEAPLQRELMLFDPESSQFFVLNGTMAFLWQHCDGHKSAEQLAAELATAFDTKEPSEVATDVREALESLLERGLIVDSASDGV